MISQPRMKHWERNWHLSLRNVFPPPPSLRASLPTHLPPAQSFPAISRCCTRADVPVPMPPSATCTRATTSPLPASCSPVMRSRMRDLHFGASQLVPKAHKQVMEPCKGGRHLLWEHGTVQLEGITLPPPSFAISV